MISTKLSLITDVTKTLFCKLCGYTSCFQVGKQTELNGYVNTAQKNVELDI